MPSINVERLYCLFLALAIDFSVDADALKRPAITISKKGAMMRFMTVNKQYVLDKYLVASYLREHATDYGSEPSETVKKKPFAFVKTQPT